MSDSKIASGLKEALKVGADNTVKLTGQRDGYFGNEASIGHVYTLAAIEVSSKKAKPKTKAKKKSR